MPAQIHYGPWRLFCWPLQRHVWSSDNQLAVLDRDLGAMKTHRIFYVCLACGARHPSSPGHSDKEQFLW